MNSFLPRTMISSVSPQSVPYSDPASPGYESRRMSLEPFSESARQLRDGVPAQLQLPKFVTNIDWNNLPSLSEQIVFKRLADLVNEEPDVTMTPAAPTKPAPCDDEFLFLANFPSQFTQSSIETFVRRFIPFPAAIIIPRVKILSFNENQKGTLRTINPGERIHVNTFAILHDKRPRRTPSLVGESLLAYGQKATILPIDSIRVLEDILSFFEHKYWTPSFAHQHPSPTEGGGSKFGGGLKRGSAPTSTAGAKFIIRVPTSAVAHISEEEWKRRGVVSSDQTNDGSLTALKFSRMEIRDAACDSFIISLELFDNREIGLSRLGDALAIVENIKSEKDLQNFPHITSFYPPRSTRPPSRYSNQY